MFDNKKDISSYQNYLLLAGFTASDNRQITPIRKLKI